jgi:hypothetical protein
MSPTLAKEATYESGSTAAEFYEQHGWFLAPPVLDDILLEQVRLGLEAHWSGHRDWALPGARTQFADWMPGDGDGTRNNEYLSLQNAVVRKLAWAAEVGRVACEVAGLSSVRLFDDQTVFKPAGQTAATVGWHVDGDYWQTCSSRQMLTAWIPLHDCPEEMGPLVVLDGSHLWSHLIDRSALSFHQRDMKELEGYVTSLGFEFKPVIMAMRRGQFSLHHCRVIHGSYPNRSAMPRIALAVHMQDGGNRYCPAFRKDGRPIQLFNDTICRRGEDGIPDYSDSDVFPELWHVNEDSFDARR